MKTIRQARRLIRLTRIVVLRIWNSDRDPHLIAARDLDLADRERLTEINQVNPTPETRLKTASKFGKPGLGESALDRSRVRRALYAVWRASESDRDPQDGLTSLHTELADEYRSRRDALTAAYAATVRIVAGTVENDHV